MTANLHSIENMGPAWCSRPVVFFNGTYDTHIKTGDDYDTATLASLFTLEPANADKMAGPAFIPSIYHDYDAREHGVQRVRGQYVALTCDIDKGNVAPRQVQDLVRGFCGDAAWLIYSSPNARPNDRRWRIIIPLENPVWFADWNDAQNALFNFLAGAGIECDRALERAAQPVFLPNVPDTHKSGEPLRDSDGKPLYYQRATTGTNAQGLSLDEGPVQAGIIAIRRKRAEDDAEREVLRAEAEKRRASRDTVTGGEIIEDFNRSARIADLLSNYGYEQCPRNAEDWRSTYQQGETYATRIISDKWVSLSSSDASAGLGAQCATGCYGDAYDLFVHFEHKGNHKAAFRQLHAERKAAQVASPPEWINEIPPPEELPDWAMNEDLEPVYDLPELPDAPALQVVDAFDFNEADIPTRPWVIPGVMLSGYTHMLAAPGGSGKSLFTLQLAITLAMGKPWGEFKALRKARTMVINVEDDIHEQRRRLSAARRVMDAPADELRGMIHVVTETDTIIVAGFDTNRRTMVAKPIVPVLVDYIRSNDIDVLIVDPFTETFEGDENDNSEVKWAMRVWRDEIARATGCVVYLVHHTTKHAGNGAGDANVVRGAGAIVNSTRISATLMPMTSDEAATMGIEESQRHMYVRYDDAKANQSLKSGKAKWFEKVSVTLCNGSQDAFPDEVGALVPWQAPGMLDGVSLHTIGQALDKIEAGILDEDGNATGSRYTSSTRGGSKENGRWVGTLLMDALGMKEAQAVNVIKMWIRTGVLVEKDYHDSLQRKLKKGLFAPHETRPGACG